MIDFGGGWMTKLGAVFLIVPGIMKIFLPEADPESIDQIGEGLVEILGGIQALGGGLMAIGIRRRIT